jgi:hypothetical protein
MFHELYGPAAPEIRSEDIVTDVVETAVIAPSIKLLVEFDILNLIPTIQPRFAAVAYENVLGPVPIVPEVVLVLVMIAVKPLGPVTPVAPTAPFVPFVPFVPGGP